MQLKKYRLQSEMESLKVGNEKWFKEYLKELLESDKEYFEKADYIAYSINELQRKIEYVSGEIKELQTLKKSLSTSKELAQELIASVFSEYGIDKLEGTAISSITLTPQKTTTKRVISIKDDNGVMGLGFVSFSVDMEAIEKAVDSKEDLEELQKFISIDTLSETIPQKIKINNKRGSSNTDNTVKEILNNSKAA